MRSITVPEVADPQQQVHVDSFQPIVKVWLFEEPLNLSQGPLLFAKRSHRNTEAKLRWLQAYAAPPALEARREPSFRLRGCAAATAKALDFVEAVEQRLEPVLPLPNGRRTLVLADTRGLHARGRGVPGEVRHSWRLKGDNDGGLKRLNPYRMDVFEL